MLELRPIVLESTNSRNYRVLQTEKLLIMTQDASTNSRNYRVLQTLTGVKVVCF